MPGDQKHFYEIEGLPVRTECCSTCNYRMDKGILAEMIVPWKRPEDIARAIKAQRLGPHKCHGAQGTVCIGSVQAENQAKLTQQIQSELLRRLGEG